MKVGVVAVQGDVSEHTKAAGIALDAMGISGRVVGVRSVGDLEGVGALIIPGGESTTISKLIIKSGLYDRIRGMAMDGVPIMGTCAGCVLLAKEGDEQVQNTHTRLLGLMDMAVKRNAFGRQRESFEGPIHIEGMVGEPFPAVFIRAPAITRVWGGCRALAKVDDRIVMAAQDNMLALAFHPELTGDTRIHEMFFGML